LGSINKAGYSLTTWVPFKYSKNILHHRVSEYPTLLLLISFPIMDINMATVRNSDLGAILTLFNVGYW